MIPPEAEELFDDASGDVALGELEAALEKYKRCTELAPDWPEPWHAAAIALTKLDRAGEAVAFSLRHTELAPNEELAWSTLSVCYGRNNQIAEAESARGKARILSWGGKIKKDA